MPRKEGQFLVEDFLVNDGGLNTADSPFLVQNSECTGGKNFDYQTPGAVQKRYGHPKANTTPDSNLKSLGLGLWDKPGVARQVIRCAGQKIQNYDINAHTFTSLTEDTAAAGSNFLTSNSSQPVVNTMFNTADAGVLWLAGGGMTIPYGAYSGTKVTKNGVPAPTASVFTATATGAGGTIGLSTGAYKYTLVYRKASTQALSNAVLEASVSVTSGTHDSVALAWTLTNNDTTKYDKIYVYRSAVSGSTQFTTGALVTILASSATSYSDTGTSTTSSTNVPRIGSLVLDNSELPSGTYNCLALFKRRLVAAKGSTVYFSDINKPESWPAAQPITLPSGGDITALAVITFSTPTSSTVDEYLCVFKQREFWIITGDGIYDSVTSLPNWSLKFISNAGAPGQAAVISANGYVGWVSHRGIFLWNGAGKPSIVSRKIRDKFQYAGDIDKSALTKAVAAFSEGRNEMQFYLSSFVEGVQRYALKLDLDKIPQSSGSVLDEKQVAGVFTPDVLPFSVYASLSFYETATSTEERILLGDDSGYIYEAFTDTTDGGSDVLFQYDTGFLSFGSPNATKRVSKVVVWVRDNGVYNLNLYYWSNYFFQTSEASARSVPVSATPDNSLAYYDASYTYDSGYVYDGGSTRIKPLTYNLTGNNSEGASIRLRFQEQSASYRPIIYGFSVYYTELGLAA